MRVVESNDDEVTIALTPAELQLFNNALNEVCNGVKDLDHDGKFETRLGRSRATARQLLRGVREALDQRQGPGSDS